MASLWFSIGDCDILGLGLGVESSEKNMDMGIDRGKQGMKGIFLVSMLL
jgi:hypothetical protein